MNGSRKLKFHMQRTETISLSLHCTRSRKRGTKNLNGKLDPIKLLQKNVGKILQDIIRSNYFLNMTPFTDEIINGAGSELKVVFTEKQPAQ